jgi:hypothetical protein
MGVTNLELAAALGKSEATLIAWLAPRDAAKHRVMPPSAKMLLEHVLREHNASKRHGKKAKSA